MGITAPIMRFFLGGRRVRRESFSCIVSVMLAVAASAVSIVFRAAVLSDMVEYELAGHGDLLAAAGIVIAVGALGLAAMLLAARTGRMGSLPLFIPAAVMSVGYMFDMIFSLLVRGTFMNIEIALFVFSVACAALAAFASSGRITPLAATIAVGGMCILTAVGAFLPYAFGISSIARTAHCLPLAALIGAETLALASLSSHAPEEKEKEIGNER